MQSTLIDIDQPPPPTPGGGKGTQQMFMWGDSAPWPNPLPFYMPFFSKKVPLLLTFYW